MRTTIEQHGETVILGRYFTIIIIHYKEYSAPTIIFEAVVKGRLPRTWPWPADITTANNKSINITLPYIDLEEVEILEAELHLQSMLLNPRNIQYFYITFRTQNISSVVQFYYPLDYRDLCIYCTVSYVPYLSNIVTEEFAKRGVQHTIYHRWYHSINQYQYNNMQSIRDSCVVTFNKGWRI